MKNRSKTHIIAHISESVNSAVVVGNGDEQNKPLLNQINYAFLYLHLAGKHDIKPSHEELKD
jgi:hypothetical protein